MSCRPVKDSLGFLSSVDGVGDNILSMEEETEEDLFRGREK